MSTIATHRRGATVATPAGNTGLFVGAHAGITWLCYEPANFRAACEHFDRVVAMPVKRARGSR